MTRPATDHRCVFIGRAADEWHHGSGKGADGLYLDPAFVVPLTRRQHVVEHVGWRELGIGEGVNLSPGILRLRRTAFLLVRLGEHHGTGVVTLPAPSVRALGRLINEVANELVAEANQIRRKT
jgi:hypothetical protein